MQASCQQGGLRVWDFLTDDGAKTGRCKVPLQCLATQRAVTHERVLRASGLGFSSFSGDWLVSSAKIGGLNLEWPSGWTYWVLVGSGEFDP